MKVLIVEDSVELAQSLSSFFDLDGHSTSSVSDLKTAEDIIAVSHFDIILLDIMSHHNLCHFHLIFLFLDILYLVPILKLPYILIKYNKLS